MIQRFGGDRPLLSDDMRSYVNMCGDTLDALGVILDADDHGVASREQAACRALEDWLDRPLTAGQMVTGRGGRPRIGLWVSPDNSSAGSLDQLMLETVTLTRPNLASEARRLANSCFQHHPPPKQAKAILGTIGQQDAPAGSLTDAIWAGSDWVASPQVPGPLAHLFEFLRLLVGDS